MDAGQFNGDGQNKKAKITLPIALGASVVNFLIANGVTIDSAVTAKDEMTLGLTVIGSVATLAVMYVIRSVLK